MLSEGLGIVVLSSVVVEDKAIHRINAGCPYKTVCRSFAVHDFRRHTSSSDSPNDYETTIPPERLPPQL